MKKVLAFVLTFVLVASLAVTAFAVPSATAVGKYKVTAGIAVNGSFTQITGTVSSGTVSYTRTGTGSDFTGWKISGTEGVDYVIVSGSADSDTIVIKPMNDITIIESYASGANIVSEYISSPATGSTALIVLGSVCIILASAAFVAKKRIAE